MVNDENSPTNTREQALLIKEAWLTMDTARTYGDLSLAEIEAALTKLDTLGSAVTQLEHRLMSARNDYRTARYELWNLVKRARAGAKASHGDDSDEYERFGGTRASNRARRRPAKTPA